MIQYQCHFGQDRNRFDRDQMHDPNLIQLFDDDDIEHVVVSQCTNTKDHDRESNIEDREFPLMDELVAVDDEPVNDDISVTSMDDESSVFVDDFCYKKQLLDDDRIGYWDQFPSLIVCRFHALL